MRKAIVAIPLAALLILANSQDASAGRGRARRHRCCHECQSNCTSSCPSYTGCTTAADSGTASPIAANTTPPPMKTPLADPSQKPTQDQSLPASTGTALHWASLFDGKSLGNWKESEFGTQGKIEVKNGEIIIGEGDGCSGITWKGLFPKTDYEISLQAERVDGSDFFCGLTFPVGDDPCSFIVGGWGGGVVGLSSINDDDASENSTASVMKFDDNRWYTIRVRVDKVRIVCWIDNEKVVDQPLKGNKISIRSEVDDSKPLGIATWKTNGAVRDIRWRPLAADERK